LSSFRKKRFAARRCAASGQMTTPARWVVSDAVAADGGPVHRLKAIQVAKTKHRRAGIVVGDEKSAALHYDMRDRASSLFPFLPRSVWLCENPRPMSKL
jgi:hypothetical protein